MKHIKEFELEVGDFLFYVHKQNNKYNITQMKLTESHFKPSGTIILNFEDHDESYISTNRFTTTMGSLKLYRYLPYGLHELETPPLVFIDETEALLQAVKLNKELQHNTNIVSYMNNIQAININDAISGRLLATKYPKTTSELVELTITTIPNFEKDGPVVTTVYLYDGEPVSLKEYLSQIPK